MTEGGLKKLKSIERRVIALQSKAESMVTDIRDFYTIKEDIEDLYALTSLAFARATLNDVSQSLTRIVEALEEAYNSEKRLMDTTDGLLSDISSPWVSEEALAEAMEIELKFSEEIIAKNTISEADCEAPVGDSEEWHEAFLIQETLRIHSRAQLIEEDKFMQEIGLKDENGQYNDFFLERLRTLKEQTND